MPMPSGMRRKSLGSFLSPIHTMEWKQDVVVGRVTYFYPKISVAVVELKEPLAVGDKVAIVGRTTHIEQVVDSIEIEREKHEERKTRSVHRVVDRAREPDIVYKHSVLNE